MEDENRSLVQIILVKNCKQPQNRKTTLNNVILKNNWVEKGGISAFGRRDEKWSSKRKKCWNN